MRVITVARKPLSESSVAANVLEHGTGALNIDACRIQTAPGEVITIGFGNPEHMHEGWRREWMSDPERWAEYNQKHLVKANTMGRWPANLILQHLNGCRQVGTTTVQSDGHFPASRPRGSQVSGPSGHTGQEGLTERFTAGETVVVWACEPGCPVADLDTSSLEGGASRFFKQVKSCE